MTNRQIIEIGKALLPYLRSDITPAELGRAAHDAMAALNRANCKDQIEPEAKPEKPESHHE